MQYSADLVAIRTHEANVLLAERRLAQRLAVDEQAVEADAAGTASAGHVRRRRHVGRRAPQLALR
ncbi:hypothetical protein PX701_07820 [Agromyces sp. H3Y2-19a]|jgi:hypothetical protein|uniref:hypothetical protein n=1 Tax=Agromyces TaxID=33877 RepID=UPI001E3C2C5C|nr:MULTISPECIES: hypothetical protein [Agromyces]MCD5345316.1 hypothetical protein [Agromyces sp. S2-1-8]MDF0513525.1 hypothetical protein [Agromyces chromiiresistens]